MKDFINKLLSLELLKTDEVEMICTKAIEILISEPNIPYIQSPVVICGDIHGQFYDLVSMFKIDGISSDKKYIFLGDYVDRGKYSVECILLLLVLKILYPSNIYLIRGNHEQKDISKTYGFYDEVLQKYGNIKVWRYACEVFMYLNVGCIVDGRVLCIHGGLSPNVISINQLKRINRFSEIKPTSEFSDIVWSDPGENNGFQKSPRGLGYYFGEDVTNTFLEVNDLKNIVRSHQLVLEGYKFHFKNRRILTVWGAPDYMGKCGNPASFLRITPDSEINEQNICVYQSTPQRIEMLGTFENI